MSQAISPISASPWFAPVVAALAGEKGRPSVTGLCGSTAGLALTTLLHPQSGKLGNRSWLIVTGSDEAAERLYDDLHFFHELVGIPTTPLALFPRWETLPYEGSAPHVGLIARRMNALHHIRTAAQTCLVTSIAALMQRLLPVDTRDEALRISMRCDVGRRERSPDPYTRQRLGRVHASVNPFFAP